jgi:hypothetical protein
MHATLHYISHDTRTFTQQSTSIIHQHEVKTGPNNPLCHKMSQYTLSDHLYHPGSSIDETPVMPSIESIYDWEEDPLDLVSSPMPENSEDSRLAVPDAYYTYSASPESLEPYYTTPSPETLIEGSCFSTPPTWTGEYAQDGYFGSCFDTPSSWIDASWPPSDTSYTEYATPFYVYLVGDTAGPDLYCPIAAVAAVAKLPWAPQEKKRAKRKPTAKPQVKSDSYCSIAAAAVVAKLPWGPQEKKRAKRIAALKIQAKPKSALKTKATPKAKAKPSPARRRNTPLGPGRVQKSKPKSKPKPKPKPKQAKAKFAKGSSTQLELGDLQHAVSSMLIPNPRFAVPKPRPGEAHMCAAPDFDEESHEKLKMLKFAV